MSIEAFEQREEALKLRARLEAAEQARLAGTLPTRWTNRASGWRRFISMAKLVLLEPAQRELEEIAQLHRNLVGPNSARKITNKIFDALSRLDLFPLSGSLPATKRCSGMGYRYVVAGKYICVYRVLGDTVYVYHIAHGASNYPLLFKRLCGMRKSKCIHVFTLPLLYRIESILIIQFLLRKEVIA